MEESQDFKPDRGNPAVRHYRGASGTVAMVEMRSHLAIERARLVTLHLQQARRSSIPTGYMLNENEFLSPYGIRSLSRHHAEYPYVFNAGGEEYRIGYVPGDSDSGMFGGNSNWRGPIWMPMQLMLIRALVN